jgi:hypothetical protein
MAITAIVSYPFHTLLVILIATISLRGPTAMSLAAAEPARFGTLKSDVTGKLWLKIRAVGGRLQRIVSQHPGFGDALFPN